jgi:crotonobetainyl-CoA:carnitine CoA-transferase CaiB-like acyl-CoA transferase
MVAANNDKQFKAMCAGIGRPDILEDARWRNPVLRADNAAALRAELVTVFRSRRAEEWESALDAVGVPAARVRSLDEILAEDHARTRGFTHRIALPQQGRAVDVPTLGFKVNDEVVRPTVPPPALGSDTATVLQDLGYDAAELRRLADAGVI